MLRLASRWCILLCMGLCTFAIAQEGEREEVRICCEAVIGHVGQVPLLLSEAREVVAGEEDEREARVRHWLMQKVSTAYARPLVRASDSPMALPKKQARHFFTKRWWPYYLAQHPDKEALEHYLGMSLAEIKRVCYARFYDEQLGSRFRSYLLGEPYFSPQEISSRAATLSKDALPDYPSLVVRQLVLAPQGGDYQGATTTLAEVRGQLQGEGEGNKQLTFDAMVAHCEAQARAGKGYKVSRTTYLGDGYMVTPWLPAPAVAPYCEAAYGLPPLEELRAGMVGGVHRFVDHADGQEKMRLLYVQGYAPAPQVETTAHYHWVEDVVYERAEEALLARWLARHVEVISLDVAWQHLVEGLRG